MFKIAAVLGLVAGGAGFAVYSYTDWFGGCSGHKACSGPTESAGVKPPCCQEKAESVEPVTSCCESSAKVVAVKASCCAGCCEAAPSATAKLAAAIGDPHVAGALLACEACATSCDATGVRAAVGGMAVVSTQGAK